MLNMSDASVIRWSDDGTSLIIRDEAQLSRVLPQFFKSDKYESFVRQLRKYGFKKKRSEGDYKVYQHESFVRDRPNLMVSIKKGKVQSGGDESRATSAVTSKVDGQPNDISADASVCDTRSRKRCKVGEFGFASEKHQTKMKQQQSNIAMKQAQKSQSASMSGHFGVPVPATTGGGDLGRMVAAAGGGGMSGGNLLGMPGLTGISGKNCSGGSAGMVGGMGVGGVGLGGGLLRGGQGPLQLVLQQQQQQQLQQLQLQLQLLAPGAAVTVGGAGGGGSDTAALLAMLTGSGNVELPTAAAATTAPAVTAAAAPAGVPPPPLAAASVAAAAPAPDGLPVPPVPAAPVPVVGTGGDGGSPINAAFLQREQSK